MQTQWQLERSKIVARREAHKAYRSQDHVFEKQELASHAVTRRCNLQTCLHNKGFVYGSVTVLQNSSGYGLGLWHKRWGHCQSCSCWKAPVAILEEAAHIGACRRNAGLALSWSTLHPGCRAQCAVSIGYTLPHPWSNSGITPRASLPKPDRRVAQFPGLQDGQ